MEAKPAQAKLLSSGNRIKQLYYVKSKWFDLVLFIFFALITFILYYTSINNYYVVDDFVRLKVVSEGSLGENFHYFPVPLIVYRLFYLIFGQSPVPIRITGMLMNALTCLYVFKISLALFRLFHKNSGADLDVFKSFIISILFCIHYIHVETLIYYAALHEVFYSLFYLLGLYVYLSYRENGTKSYLVWVFVFYALCMFSKETAVSFILCLFAADLFLFRKKFTEFIKDFYFLFIITLIFIVIRYFVYPKFDSFSYSFSLISLFSESVKNLIFTFTAFIVSLDFTLIRDIYKSNNLNIFNTLKAIFQDYPVAIAGLFVSFTVYLKVLRKPDKIIYLSFVFILITISSFIWLAGYERYLYLPSIGFWIIIVHHCFVMYGAGKIYRGIIAAVLLFFFVYNIYSLIQKKSNWETASEISRNAVGNIVSLTRGLPPGSVVYFKDIPTEYKGAWVIRYEVHLFPELFLKRNDISFYYLYERPEINDNKNKVYIYEYKNNRLIEE